MATAPVVTLSTEIPTLQQTITEIEQVGQVAASPFIKSPEGQATESKVISEVNLGVAALPLFAALFQNIANLFHHAHKASTQGVQSTTSEK